MPCLKELNQQQQVDRNPTIMSLQFPKDMQDHNAISVKCRMLQPAAAQLPLKL